MNLRLVLPLSCLLAVFACGAPTPPQCTVPAENPVVHTSLSAGETWASGVHEVPSSLSLSGAGTLTIAPCSEVRLGADASLRFSGGASLVATGTQADPIRFVRRDPARAWGAINVREPGTASLSWATLEGGGSNDAFAVADFKGASLVGDGSGENPQVVLRVEHVTVKRSTGLGVALVRSRFDAASTDLVITGSGWFPLYLGADSLTTLPTGTYTGNTIDEVVLQSVSTANYENLRSLHEAVVMHDRGVPYRVAGDIRIGDGFATTAAGTLTIEAGVTLRFEPGRSRRILMDAALVGSTWVPRGTLIVAGTAARKVTFTSAAPDPKAGDWMGLYFAHVVAPGSLVDHAVIEYAGADSGSTGVCKASVGATNYDADCSVIFFLDGDLTTGQIITNTRIALSQGCGVYRGWHGTDVDFRPTNTFVALTGCKQSNVPPPQMQVCADVPCQ